VAENYLYPQTPCENLNYGIVYETEMLLFEDELISENDTLCREDNKFIIQGTESKR